MNPDHKILREDKSDGAKPKEAYMRHTRFKGQSSCGSSDVKRKLEGHTCAVGYRIHKYSARHSCLSKEVFWTNLRKFNSCIVRVWPATQPYTRVTFAEEKFLISVFFFFVKTTKRVSNQVEITTVYKIFQLCMRFSVLHVLEVLC